MQTKLVSVYYSVPDHAGSGSNFQLFTDAVEAAQKAIHSLDEWDNGVEQFSRAFVDERHVTELDGTQSDTVSKRWEVFHDGRTVLTDEGLAPSEAAVAAVAVAPAPLLGSTLEREGWTYPFPLPPVSPPRIPARDEA